MLLMYENMYCTYSKIMSHRLKNLFPQLQNISGKEIVSRDVHAKHIESIKQKHINEAKSVFQYLKTNIDLFCNKEDITQKITALQNIYSKAQYMTVFQPLFDELFFDNLHKTAFEDNGSIPLTTHSFTLLSYILINCEWADEIIRTKQFFEDSLGFLLSDEYLVRPEVISTFIVNFLRKFDTQGYEFPFELFEYYTNYYKKAKFVNDKIWVLESIVGIVSSPSFKQEECVDDLIDFAKNVVAESQESDVGISLAEQSLYILASIYVCDINYEKKSLILDDNVLQAVTNIYDHNNEALATVALTFLINALYYDVTIIQYFIQNQLYEKILSLYSETFDSPKLKQKIVQLAFSSINYGSDVMSIIQRTQFIQVLSDGYDSYPFYLQSEIISFFCKVLVNVQENDIQQILELTSFDIFVDHITSNNKDIIGKILVFLLHLLDNIEKAPYIFQAGIHNLYNDILLDRLDEISQWDIKEFAYYAQQVNAKIMSLKK